MYAGITFTLHADNTDGVLAGSRIERVRKANCPRGQDAKPRAFLRQPGCRLQGGFDGIATIYGIPG